MTQVEVKDHNFPITFFYLKAIDFEGIKGINALGIKGINALDW